LLDDHNCEADPTCINCPPATIDDVHNLASCTDAGGNPCEPLKRDLGLLVVHDYPDRRLCLVRQAPRTPNGTGYCNVPASGPAGEGWFYVPTGAITASPPDPPCPQVMFGRGATGSLIEVGSSAELRCLSQLCPQDRQCGPTTGVPGTDPTIPCCDPSDVDGDTTLEDFVCDAPAPRDRPGTCVQAP
jgi:hypothetical protein